MRFFPGSEFMVLVASAQTYREHVAMRRVQNGVLGEVDENREAMTLAASQHDQVRALFLGHPQNLCLGIAHFDPATHVPGAGARDELPDSCARAVDEVL